MFHFVLAFPAGLGSPSAHQPAERQSGTDLENNVGRLRREDDGAMVRDMGVRKNIHIEDWASRRENLEHVFKYSKGNWARLAVWGVAVPFLFYKGICAEFVSFFFDSGTFDVLNACGNVY